MYYLTIVFENDYFLLQFCYELMGKREFSLIEKYEHLGYNITYCYIFYLFYQNWAYL